MPAATSERVDQAWRCVVLWPSMMVTSRQLTDACRRFLTDLPVVFVYLYGSEALGTTHVESDVDVAVAFSVSDTDQKLLLKTFARLEPLFGLHPEQLDLQDFMRLPLAVQFRVVRDGQLIYLTDERQHRDIVLKAVARYHDEVPMHRRLLEARLA